MKSRNPAIDSIVTWGTAVWFAIAVLVAVATIVPIWLLFISPRTDMRYQIVGPFPNGSGSAYGISIFNVGSEEAENIRFSLKVTSSITSAVQNNNDFISKSSLDILDSQKEIFFSAESFPPADVIPPNNRVMIFLMTNSADEAQIIEVKCTFSKGLCIKDIYILPIIYKLWLVIATTIALVMILVYVPSLIKPKGVAFATP